MLQNTKQILRALKIYNQDLKIKILKGNEDKGIHWDVYGDGSRWEFQAFSSLNTIKKIRNFLQY